MFLQTIHKRWTGTGSTGSKQWYQKRVTTTLAQLASATVFLRGLWDYEVYQIINKQEEPQLQYQVSEKTPSHQKIL